MKHKKNLILLLILIIIISASSYFIYKNNKKNYLYEPGLSHLYIDGEFIIKMNDGYDINDAKKIASNIGATIKSETIRGTLLFKMNKEIKDLETMRKIETQLKTFPEIKLAMMNF